MSVPDDGVEIRRGDAGYPARVAELRGAPPVLYVRGDPSALDAPALAVIGSRRATPYGLAVAEMAGRMAAEAGIAVVSGGARGCDQAAGWAALRAGGRHVVVLGTGADDGSVYPATARGLVRRALAAGGAAVSLEPWGAGPQRWAFPKRNRVIAALSGALVVAEAGMPSGTFSTAEASVELGHEVLAVPGSIFSPESRGSNRLIADGACCIADEEALEVALSRIYGTLRFCRAPARGLEAGDACEQRVLAALVANPMRTEDLAAGLGLGGVDCLMRLSALEARGAVERLADGRWAPAKSALHAMTALGQNG